jgi:hypothetical protein
MRTLAATRYVMPFREGGSLPALVEAEDQGLYVVKLRGAGQGPRVLIAEWIAGELARAAGLRVPELVGITIDPALGRAEPDSEIRELLRASIGLNLALDYLPGAVTWDQLAEPCPDALEASRIVLFDALVLNVDRTPKNPNLLCWHDALWLIDHGASLFFHHSWSPENRLASASSVFAPIRQHVLLPFADQLEEAATSLRQALTEARLAEIVTQLPDDWLNAADGGFADPAAHREAYLQWLRARLLSMPLFLEEAKRVHANVV